MFSEKKFSFTEKQRFDGWFNNLAHPPWGSIGKSKKSLKKKKKMDVVRSNSIRVLYIVAYRPVNEIRTFAGERKIRRLLFNSNVYGKIFVFSAVSEWCVDLKFWNRVRRAQLDVLSFRIFTSEYVVLRVYDIRHPAEGRRRSRAIYITLSIVFGPIL